MAFGISGSDRNRISLARFVATLLFFPVGTKITGSSVPERTGIDGLLGFTTWSQIFNTWNKNGGNCPAMIVAP
jgi:hypothetical protein